MDRVREDRIWRTLDATDEAREALRDATQAIFKLADTCQVPRHEAAAFLAERFGILTSQRNLSPDDMAELERDLGII